MDKFPSIEAEITFIPKSEEGRETIPQLRLTMIMSKSQLKSGSVITEPLLLINPD
jgi:hypothetical protein